MNCESCRNYEPKEKGNGKNSIGFEKLVKQMKDFNNSMWRVSFVRTGVQEWTLKTKGNMLDQYLRSAVR